MKFKQAAESYRGGGGEKDDGSRVENAQELYGSQT